MASGERLADAGRTSSSHGCGAGNESNPVVQVHTCTGSSHGRYLAGCKGPVLLLANAASKQKVEVARQRIVIIHSSITRLGRPRRAAGAVAHGLMDNIATLLLDTTTQPRGHRHTGRTASTRRFDQYVDVRVVVS